ncbi:DUF6882 domain-containing protein [Hydrogenophaga sp. RWCD_12]|uniref:DUF6882 domain-containing protein n=1 Tax=Hydrogenophaga sp. RWCD_12 TaxID=3391190 RepID=UPI0039849094
MSDDEFQNFVDDCFNQLEKKQDYLQETFALGAHARWHVDQISEKLQFFDSTDRLVVQATVINIGSFAANSNTWKWAWANDSVPPGLRKKSEPLKELSTVTGLDLFSSVDPVSVEDENMAWEVAAMCVHHLNALGAYRAPSSSRPLAVFLAITSIEHVRKERYGNAIESHEGQPLEVEDTARHVGVHDAHGREGR